MYWECLLENQVILTAEALKRLHPTKNLMYMDEILSGEVGRNYLNLGIAGINT